MAARDIAASCHLLCVDELHIADVADAMTLGRLFEALLHHGCWTAFTVSFECARESMKYA